MLNTISQLNEKIWYRLLKVIYIAALSFFIIISISFVYYDNKLPAKYLQKEALLTKLEKSVGINEVVIFISANNSKYKEIKKDMDIIRGEGGGRIDAERYLKEVKGISYSISDQYCIRPITDKMSLGKIGKIIKTINPVYIKDDDYILGEAAYDTFFRKIECDDAPFSSFLKTICYSIIWISIWLILFEVIRRVFYYVVLGKLSPLR